MEVLAVLAVSWLDEVTACILLTSKVKVSEPDVLDLAMNLSLAISKLPDGAESLLVGSIPTTRDILPVVFA